MIILGLILFFQFFLVSKIIKYFLLSPIYIYIIFSLISIILSICYFYFFNNKFYLFNLDRVSEKEFLETIKLYLIALNSFLFGVILYYEQFTKKRVKIIFNKSFTKNLFIKYSLPSFMNKITIVVFLIIVILYFIVYGKGVFLRYDYLPQTNKPLTILLKIITFIEITLLGLIYNKKKMLSGSLFILTIILSISTGSRSVFLFFIFYVCLVFISSRNNFFNKFRFSLHICFGFILLAYIMTLRSLDLHGLIPYIKSINNSYTDFYREVLFNIYYSFIYGTYVTINTLERAQLDWYIIWVNVNPLPGKMTNWYEYANKMRINFYVPYSLHGRVFKTGMLFTVIYFIITGIIFTYFESIIRKYLNKNKKIIPFLIILLLCLHIVYAFEYNMRAAIRYFYYAFFILLMLYFFKEIKRNLPKRKIK